MFVVLYIDGFNCFSKVQHPIDGIYATFGNFPQYLLRCLENIFCLALAPPGASYEEYMSKLKPAILKLQEGFYVDLGYPHGKVFVVGAVGVVLADWPMGKQLIPTQHNTS